MSDGLASRAKGPVPAAGTGKTAAGPQASARASPAPVLVRHWHLGHAKGIFAVGHKGQVAARSRWASPGGPVPVGRYRWDGALAHRSHGCKLGGNGGPRQDEVAAIAAAFRRSLPGVHLAACRGRDAAIPGRTPMGRRGGSLRTLPAARHDKASEVVPARHAGSCDGHAAGKRRARSRCRPDPARAALRSLPGSQPIDLVSPEHQLSLSPGRPA